MQHFENQVASRMVDWQKIFALEKSLKLLIKIFSFYVAI
tara:strand:- start:764 stop:880 length:117 start_codon:yes stop_codon:yes gene_type:complete